ncbi:hypothetical protein QBC33DRAFT_561067 [Phialemonium atrogriseum]|uniref:Uncharacterized protein n=1 Tax=Phialemonium atrogriseum TaxID=1093897 RepID=A0AAJ0C050_9PEZI|nr:uncharacterized protein QBC33DRAFT_561067 [Phialemonium atrogriseum]KAK1765246.1 hypothetical protein QBC33DRAFT_561067 [Phialemonium atrogriseum]
MDAGIGAYDSVQTASDTMPAATTADLARFNPHRDLLPTQDRVLRDLIYIKHVLGDLIPTTLPEDDYQLYSDLLRSLEARTDISWRVYEETNIGKTIMAAANRRGPIANEPFFIGDRIKALHKHWHALELTSDRPERWESASDTMFLNPIIQGRALGGGGKHLDAAQQTSMSDSASGHFKLTLSPEQEVEATSIYTKWRRKRDHRVSYLKLHPPQPVAWVPVSRSDVGARNAWGTLFDDGTVSAGRRVSYSRLVGNKEWKPIFSSMDWAYVPHDWAAPGEQAPTDEDLKKDIEALIAEGDKKAERNTKQVLYQQELKAQLRQQEEKREL